MIVSLFQNIIGGIVGAKTAILSPVLNIVKGIKSGVLGVAGGILQAKGNLIASKGALLASLGESLKGGNGGSYGAPSVGGMSSLSRPTLPSLVCLKVDLTECPRLPTEVPDPPEE